MTIMETLDGFLPRDIRITAGGTAKRPDGTTYGFGNNTRCAVCGKQFYVPVAGEWGYTIRGDKRVCSYKCMRAYEVPAKQKRLALFAEQAAEDDALEAAKMREKGANDVHNQGNG